MRALLAVMVVLALAVSAQGGLVGYWNFNEGSGQTAADLSPNANHGWVSNGLSWAAGHTGQPGDCAIQSDSSIGYVRVPDSASLDTLASSPFTIAMWANRASAAGPGYMLWLTGGGGIRWYMQADGASATIGSESEPSWNTVLGFPIQQGAWHHYALVFHPVNGCHLVAYVDGVEVGSWIIHPQSQALPDFSDSLRIGGHGDQGDSFNGLLDDVAIFNSVEDVPSVMNGSHPAMIPEPATLALMGLGSVAMLLRRRKR